MKVLLVFAVLLSPLSPLAFSAEPPRSMRFQAGSPAEALAWQERTRDKLFALMMGGQRPPRVPLDPQVLRRMEEPALGCVLEELTLQTLPDRRAHVWLARPLRSSGKVGAVLAIHGHGGSGEQIVRGQSLYWYGRELIEMGCVVISPDVGQHELQHTNWTLMGERTWDALRCLDYVAMLPEVDSARLAVAGLSLGGETTMYVAALDERLKLACSSGWLTTVANMKNGHCKCFNFLGLEENFDFADIFACVAPRVLVCELGEQERAPGGFPVAIGRQALAEIRPAYHVFNADSNLTLTVHTGPHVFKGTDFLPRLRAAFGENCRPVCDDAATVAWCRFSDGPESLDGTPYYWLGRTGLKVTFDVVPRKGDALMLGWGGKSDQREALIVVNGRPVTVGTGGHWGFRWVKVPVPEETTGRRYEIEIKPGRGLAAFLSEVRLVSPAAKSTSLDRRTTRYQAELKVTP